MMPDPRTCRSKGSPFLPWRQIGYTRTGRRPARRSLGVIRFRVRRGVGTPALLRKQPRTSPQLGALPNSPICADTVGGHQACANVHIGGSGAGLVRLLATLGEGLGRGGRVR